MRPGAWEHRWAVIATATVAAITAFYAVFTLHRPFHLDTILYIEDARRSLDALVVEPR